jgi:F5/8 type C domain
MWIAAAALLAMALGGDVDLTDARRFGSVISKDSIIRCSSTSPWDEPEYHLSLLGQGHEPFAFHTAEDDRPWVHIDLGRAERVTGVSIRNRTDGNGARTKALAISLSTDGIAWNEITAVEGPRSEWNVSLLDGEAARDARYVRITLPEKGFLHLSRVHVYGRGGKP